MEGDSNIEKGSNWFVRTDLHFFYYLFENGNESDKSCARIQFQGYGNIEFSITSARYRLSIP